MKNTSSIGSAQESSNNWKIRALEFANEGIVITDAKQENNPIVYVNQGFRNITGYTDSDAIGKNCRFMRGKDTDEATTQSIRESIKDAVPFSAEILNYRKDGTPFWNQLNISPILDENGKVTHFVGIQLDVTRHKETQSELDKARQQLIIAERLRAIGEMAAGLAHEINNPVTAIYHRARQAIRGMENKTPAQISQEEWNSIISKMRDIESMGSRIGKIISDMTLFISKSEPNKADPVSLADSIEYALHLHKERIDLQNVKINFEIHKDVMCLGNSVQIEQIFEKLFSNALDATTGQLSPVITISAQQVKNEIVVEVFDTAPLISVELSTRIFEPFFTTKDVGQGTGLGLSISSLLAQQNGGKILLEQKNGRNIFKVFLPSVDRQTPTHCA